MKGELTLQRFGYKAALYLKQHSSTILTYLGAFGVAATAVTAVKATPKAMRLLEKATDEKGEELTKLETVQIAGPSYIPSIVIGASTIACIFGANVLNKQQQAALASAYALADRSYKEYRNKVKEMLGEETDIHIREAIVKDKRKDTDAYVPGYNSIDTSGETCLFYEEYRGAYFEATMAAVLNAEYHFNRNFAMREYACLNEFYDFLGLEQTDFGDTMGWSSWQMMEEYEAHWIDFNHRLVTLEDGLECYIIEMPIPPTTNFEEF